MKQKNIINLSILGFIALIFGYSQTYAAITITVGSGARATPADEAANATSPAWSYLGQIRITEGANTDIQNSATNKTLILTLPTGWIFNTATGSVSYTASRDLTAASLSVGSTTLTITMSTNGNPTAADVLNINNIQVRPLSGHLLPSSGQLLRLASNPGTMPIIGLTTGVSNFAQMYMVTGALRNLDVLMPGQTWGGAGVGVLGTPSYIFPNLSFVLPDMYAVDQFDNLVSIFSGSRTLTYTGVSSASGANSFTTAVNFWAGNSTTTLNTILRTPGVYRLVIRSGSVVTGTGSWFRIMDGTLDITAPASISMPSVGASTSNTTNFANSTLFTVEDQKGYSSGYYTTLQCSNLVMGSTIISNSNISLSGSALTLISGSANASVYNDMDNTMQTCNSPIPFIRRDTGGGGAQIFSEYGATITVRVTIPGWQAVGSYSSTLTYTIIEN